MYPSDISRTQKPCNFEQVTLIYLYSNTKSCTNMSKPSPANYLLRKVGQGTYGTVSLNHIGQAVKSTPVRYNLDYSHYKEHSIFNKLKDLDGELVKPIRVVVANSGNYINNIYYYMKYYKYTCHNLPKEILKQNTDTIIRQLLLQLDALQRIGVQHRDIKTSNILLDESLNLVLVDFSLSKCNSFLVRDETVSFYNPVSPPEFNLNSKATTAGFDMWSLGLVFYYIFTLGQVKIYEETIDAMISKLYTPEEANAYVYQRKKVFTLWNSLNSGILTQKQFDLIRQMTDIDPEKRPSAAKLLSQLYSDYMYTNPTTSYLNYANKFEAEYKNLNWRQICSRVKAIGRLNSISAKYNISSNVYFTTIIIMDEMINYDSTINIQVLIEAACLASIKINEYITVYTDDFLQTINSNFKVSAIESIEALIFRYIDDKLFPLPNYIMRMLGSCDKHEEHVLKALYILRQNYNMSTVSLAKLCQKISGSISPKELEMNVQLYLDDPGSDRLEKILLKNIGQL